MTRLSNPVTINIVAPGSNALAALASSMSPDSFADVPSPGNMVNGFFDTFNAATIPAGLAYDTNALTYTSRACYDNVRGKVYIYDGTHAAFSQGSGYPAETKGPGVSFFWTYTLATNSWTKVDCLPTIKMPTVFFGLHGYEHLTVNPTTGTLYYRQYGSAGQAYSLPYNTSPIDDNWTPMASTFYSANIGGTIDYWSALNGGAGGLIVAGQVNIQSSNSAITAWNTPIPVADDLSNYQQWGSATDNFYYWGYNLACRRIAPTMGTSSRIADLPVGAYVSALGGPMCRAHPNGTDLILFPYQLAGDIYIYTVAAGQPPFNSVVSENALSATTCVSCTLKDLGVILIVHCNGNNLSTGQAMTLYKPPV
jgi:hypothetical protein